MRRLIRKEILVTLDTGDAFRGILWQARREVLVLRNAAQVLAGGTVSADGEVVVPRGRVSFVQVLG